jgi:flagellin
MARLSSGYRINRAADDAAGLSLSNNLISQIRKSQQADRNTNDGMSALDLADGSLSVITDTLQRIRELTVQAGNDTNDAVSRSSISHEVQLLMQSINQISSSTQLNGIYLLNGTANNAILQVGPDSSSSSKIDISAAFTNSSSGALGAVGSSLTFTDVSTINLSSNAKALAFLKDIDSAIANVSKQRSSIGAYQNRLTNIDQNLTSSVVNLSSANSRIRDVDVASETATMAQAQVLTQASTMILSQTNDLPKMILNLLQK